MAVQFILHGKKTVTTAGTRVALSATALYVGAVYIEAEEGNSGKIYVGDATVSSSKYASVLAAGESFQIASEGVIGTGCEQSYYHDAINLAEIYIDASANNQSVQVSYTTPK